VKCFLIHEYQNGKDRRTHRIKAKRFEPYKFTPNKFKAFVNTLIPVNASLINA
jgi:hypothetical protein